MSYVATRAIQCSTGKPQRRCNLSDGMRKQLGYELSLQRSQKAIRRTTRPFTLAKMSTTIALFTGEFPPYPGGIGTYCLEIANAAQRIGFDPVVFAPWMPPPERVDTAIEVNYMMPSYYRHVSIPRVAAIVSRELVRRSFKYAVAVDLNHVLPVALARTKSKKIAVVHGTDAQSRFIRFINTYTPIKPYNVFLRTAANSQFTKN